MLPEALRLNKKQREHDQLVEFVNHLQATVAREGFLGDNLRPSLETLTALAEGMERYNKDYKADFFIAEETNVKSLSGWKNQRMQGGGPTMFQTLKTPKGYIYTVYIAAGRIAFCSSLYRPVSDSSGVRWVAV